MARARDDLGALAGDSRWTGLGSNPGMRLWTDDYSNMFGVLRMLERGSR
jgi:hypothetical protein